MSHLFETPAPPDSGVLPSVDADVITRSPLTVAVSYWPGRWTRATVVAALALEPLVAPTCDAQSWAALLDRLDAAIVGSVVDPAVFP